MLDKEDRDALYGNARDLSVELQQKLAAEAHSSDAEHAAYTAIGQIVSAFLRAATSDEPRSGSIA